MKEYIRADEFFRSAIPNTTAKEVVEELLKKRDRTILDIDLIQSQEIWSFLLNKIFGAEGN
jgi:hypothetical protein